LVDHDMLNAVCRYKRGPSEEEWKHWVACCPNVFVANGIVTTTKHPTAALFAACLAWLKTKQIILSGVVVHACCGQEDNWPPPELFKADTIIRHTDVFRYNEEVVQGDCRQLQRKYAIGSVDSVLVVSACFGGGSTADFWCSYAMVVKPGGFVICLDYHTTVSEGCVLCVCCVCAVMCCVRVCSVCAVYTGTVLCAVCVLRCVCVLCVCCLHWLCIRLC
jgi:hypothetical protein